MLYKNASDPVIGMPNSNKGNNIEKLAELFAVSAAVSFAIGLSTNYFSNARAKVLERVVVTAGTSPAKNPITVPLRLLMIFCQ